MSGSGAPRRGARLLALSAAVALAVAWGLIWPDGALAETFTVTNTKDAGKGSLRKAILSANARMGADTIRFRIDGRGVKTIRPQSPLPGITTDALTIDGYTQPGAKRNTLTNGTNAKLKIQLDGTNAQGGFAALVVGPGADGSRVSGLIINRFDNSGISIEAGGCSVAGNFIGTNASGNADLGNGDIGVNVGGNADSNTIGGEFLTARNLISGNEGHGVRIDGDSAENNAVWSNLIGTNAAGNAALGNTGTGVALTDGSSGNLIGGRFEGARNVISGNGDDGVSMVASDNVVQGNFIGTDAAGNADLGNAGGGVVIEAGGGHLIGGALEGARNVISGNGDGVLIRGSANNRIQGNFIGTDKDGNADVGNAGAGVLLLVNAANNDIGGPSAGEGNTIAANLSGVALNADAGVGNSILSNSIFSNAGLGIDLGAPGVTANDGDNPLTPTVVETDSDTGPNNLQNFPVLQSATMSNLTLTVSGSLESIPRRGFTIQVFDAAPDSPGERNGEGNRLLCQPEVATTGTNGDATFTCSVNVGLLPPDNVTATATSVATGDTSEFAENVAVR